MTELYKEDLGKIIGEDGISPKIKIGTVETASDEQDPDVYIESFDKEDNSYTFGFVLPQGGGGGTSFIPVTPTQVGELKYTGEELEPQWNSFDPSVLDISGDITGIEAGTYNVTFTPKKGNYWLDDFSNTSRNSIWKIEKNDQIISASTNSIVLNVDSPTNTFVIYGAKTHPTISVNNSYVSYEEKYENETFTVDITAQKRGETTFTIKAPFNNNWNESNTINIKVDASNYVGVYGVEWDGTASTTWFRTDSSVNFVDPVVYDDTEECKNGSLTDYTSPFDEIYPWNGMTTSTDSKLGTLVSIPKFYYKLTQTGNKIKIQISELKLDGFHISPAHMDRGDGKGERETIYVGRYHCARDSRKSEKSEKLYYSSRYGSRNAISGLDDTCWLIDWATWFTIWLLYLVEFADWDSQSCIGYGDGSHQIPTGGTDDMPYHTGQTNNGTYTYNQYRNIESLWNNVFTWLDGCYGITNTSSSDFYVILNPNNFNDSNTGRDPYGGTPIGKTIYGTYPSKFKVVDVAGTFPAFLPSENKGTNSTYSCDEWHFDTYSGGATYVGGATGSEDEGLFYLDVWNPTSSNDYRGSRLQKLP